MLDKESSLENSDLELAGTADREAEAASPLPTAELYAQLQEVDPELAAYVHPANRRRVQAGLQYFQQTG